MSGTEYVLINVGYCSCYHCLVEQNVFCFLLTMLTINKLASIFHTSAVRKGSTLIPQYTDWVSVSFYSKISLLSKYLLFLPYLHALKYSYHLFCTMVNFFHFSQIVGCSSFQLCPTLCNPM